MYIDFFSNVGVNPLSVSAIISLVVLVFLLAISAFISASEVAFFALEPAQKSQLNTENKKDDLIIRLKNAPEKLLATIVTGNNLVNIAIIILSTCFLNTLFDFSQALLFGFIIQTVIITFLLLLFGEIIPKVYASQNALQVARYSAKAIRVLQIAVYPLVKLLVNSTTFVNKRLAKHTHTNISVDELSHALELTSKQSDEDKEILEGIIKFGNISVEKIMTPRIDMVDIDIKIPFGKVVEKILEAGYSRVPVYLGSKDNIRGILYIKDLLAHLDKGDNFRWQTLIRRAYFVPETKKIDDLLSDFQRQKIHIAVVVDEFVGTSGIVTMEDVMEEIFGEIKDEYDEGEESLFKKIDETTYFFEGKILLTDFFRITKIDETPFEKLTADVDTLAGLILAITGDFPIKNQQIPFDKYIFEILSVDERRIKNVKFIKI